MVDRRRAIYLYAVAGISLLLVVLSVATANQELLPPALRQTIHRYFSLARENNIAAWWSGSLLFIAAMHALDGFAKLTRAGDRRTAMAWAALALVLTALSLDEIGSLHERVSRFLPLESWWAILPFAIVLLGLTAWSLLRLFTHHRPRADIVLIAACFACFASVALQEELEHSLEWPAWALPLRLGAEEGTELIGMFLLIVATSACSGGVFARRPTDAESPVFSISEAFATRQSLIVVVLLVVSFAIGTAQLTDTQRGHPADWLAAMLFLLATLVACSSALEGKTFSLREIAAGGVCLWASGTTVQVGSDQITTFGTWVVNDRLAALALLLAALAAIPATADENGGRFTSPRSLLALAAVVLAAFAAVAPSRLVVYLLTGYAATLTYWCIVRWTRRLRLGNERAPATAPLPAIPRLS